jgi:hypothetical protein
MQELQEMMLNLRLWMQSRRRVSYAVSHPATHMR